MIDVEKEAVLRLCQGQIKILEGYRTNVKQAISGLEESKSIYRSVHSVNTRQWQGPTRDEYEKLARELKVLEVGVYNMGEQLIAAINKEIHQLKGKAGK